MYKLVMFDLDGTLLNTINDLATATNVALSSFGYMQHELNAYKTFVGNGIYKLVERSMPSDKRNHENVLRVKAVFDEYYKLHNQDQTVPYEGIEDLLDRLNAKGIKCGVVTNKAHLYACKLIAEYFPHQIGLVLGQREGIPHKPHPQGLIEMMTYFGVTPEECLYVGDSNVDIETAKAAGIQSIGVLWGFRGEEELIRAGADFIVQSTEEIIDIILK